MNILAGPSQGKLSARAWAPTPNTPNSDHSQKAASLETDLVALVLPLHKTLGRTTCDRPYVVIFDLQIQQALICCLWNGALVGG